MTQPAADVAATRPPSLDRPRDAADLARLLADRGLLRGALGPVAARAWTVAWPVGGGIALVALSSGSFEWFLTGVGIVVTSFSFRRLRNEAIAARAALLAPDLDAGWLPALADALNAPDCRVRAVARQRLITLLPQLDDAAFRQLGDAGRSALYEQLVPSQAARRPDLAAAVLDAAARFGDDQALERVRRLAALNPWDLPLARTCTRARAALVEIEQRVAREMALQPAMAARPDVAGQAAAGVAAADGQRAEAAGRASMRYPYLVAVWAVFVPYFSWMAWSAAADGRFAVCGVFAAAAAASTQLYRLAITPSRLRLARRLAAADDVRAAGDLADMLQWPEPQVRRAAMAGLTRVLPRLRASDSTVLSPAHRTVLCGCLTLDQSRAHSDFVLAVLAALEQVGDLEAVPAVQALARATPATPRERRVRDAARECLPFLLERAQQNGLSQRLLRAYAGEPSPERLLRSVGGTTSDPAQLMRASREGGEE